MVAFDSGKNSDIVQATCATDHYEAAARAAQELCDAIGGKGQLAVLLADDSSESGVQDGTVLWINPSGLPGGGSG